MANTLRQQGEYIKTAKANTLRQQGNTLRQQGEHIKTTRGTH